MSDKTALDRVITRFNTGHACTSSNGRDMQLVIDARAELAALRARVAELEAAQADTLTPQVCQQCGTDCNVTLEQRIDAFLAANLPATLTPNNCRHCHKAAEKMREAAARLVNDYDVDMLYPAIDGDDLDEVVSRDSKMRDAIRALPLPTCGDCNPLKPVVDYTHVKPQSHAALREQLDELVKIANINGLYDAADYIRRED